MSEPNALEPKEQHGHRHGDAERAYHASERSGTGQHLTPSGQRGATDFVDDLTEGELQQPAGAGSELTYPPDRPLND